MWVTGFKVNAAEASPVCFSTSGALDIVISGCQRVMKTGGSLKAVKVIPGESRRHAPGARLGLHVSLDVKAARVSCLQCI